MWVPAQLVCISHRHGLSWQTTDGHWPDFPQLQPLFGLAMLQQWRAGGNRAGSVSWERSLCLCLGLLACAQCPPNHLLMPGLSRQGVFRMLWQVRVCYSPLFPPRDSCDSRIHSVLCVLAL